MQVWTSRVMTFLRFGWRLSQNSTLHMQRNYRGRRRRDNAESIKRLYLCAVLGARSKVLLHLSQFRSFHLLWGCSLGDMILWVITRSWVRGGRVWVSDSEREKTAWKLHKLNNHREQILKLQKRVIWNVPAQKYALPIKNTTESTVLKTQSLC